MTRIDIDAALAAANPLSDRDAAALPLHEADIELVERIVVIPVSPHLPRARARVLNGRRLGLVLAVTAAVAAVLAVLPSGRDDGGPVSAFAAPLVRFANASPLVLLQLSGWHVVYADETADGFGEMHFVRGAADENGNPQGASFSNQASQGRHGLVLLGVASEDPLTRACAVDRAGEQFPTEPLTLWAPPRG